MRYPLAGTYARLVRNGEPLNIAPPVSTISHDIVAKLWNLCNVLKDDGVTYHQYVTELTYLLFLKMAKETKTEGQLSEAYRWDDLVQAESDQLAFYRHLLNHLGRHGRSLVKQIFANASSFIKKPSTLSTLVTEIDKLDWYNAKQEGLGDIYEGLLEKNAEDTRNEVGYSSYSSQVYLLETELIKYVKHVTKRVDKIRQHVHHISGHYQN